MSTKKKGLRASKNYKEIMSVLNYAKELPGSFIWQTQAEKRISIEVKIIKIDALQQRIDLQLLTPTDTFTTSLPTFIKLPIKDSAFKVNIIEFQENRALIEFPFQLVLEENRSEPRVKFRASDGKTITLVLNDKKATFQATNASPSGFGLCTNPNNASKINIGDTVQVHSLNDFALNPPFNAKIMNKYVVSKKQTTAQSEDLLHFGLKLEKTLPTDFYQKFTFIDKHVQFDDPKFFKDQAYRDLVKQNMAKTYSKLIQKKGLKGIFDKLNQKRNESSYLKNHIELLCEVMCQVGRDLGWVSEANFEKLIYVAYLHDVKLFDHAHLARILDRRDLDVARMKLTEEEVKLVTEAPVYAAELAMEDQGTYPDAHKILIQHREHPSGNGFPYGLKASQLAPLTCLFLVSHAFVDYIIDEPEWSYNEFVSTYKKSFAGPHFHKIFQYFSDLK